MTEEEIAILKQEFHEKLEEMKEIWQRLQAWATENSEALYEEAAIHKQWYIEEIAKVLDIDTTLDGEYDYERGIAP